MQSLTADEIPELLLRLVDKSLVHYDPSTGRYGLLQLVRQFGQEETFRGDESATLRSRHLEYFYESTKGKRERTRGPEANSELEATERDYEDLRLAFEWAISREDTWAIAADIAAEVFILWYMRSFIDDGIRWLQAVADAAPAGVDSKLSEIYGRLGDLQLRQKKPEAADSLEKCLALARKSNNTAALSRGLVTKALYEWRDGDDNLVEGLLKEGAQVCMDNHDAQLLGGALLNLGNFAIYQGRLEDAERHMAETQKVWKENVRGLSMLDANRAHLCERKGDYEGEYKWALVALKSFSSIGDRRNGAVAISHGCGGFWLANDFVTAARMLGCCQGILETHHIQGDALDEQSFSRWESRLREKMGDAAFDIPFEDGKKMQLEDAVEFLFANPEPWA